MSPILRKDELLNKNVLLLDGGLGTTLEDDYGVKFDSSTPLWSSHLLVTDPDTLEKVQASFVNAGVDILLTPTYQASHGGFTRTILDGERIDYFEEICQYLDLAVDISHHTFNNRSGLVALSLGAYGATMSPSQEYGGQYGEFCDEIKLEHWHVERIAMFWASWDKVDIIAFETIPRLEEVKAIRTAANVNRNARVTKPYWVTCVFPRDDDRLPDGHSIEDVVSVLFEDRKWHDGTSMISPWGIGVNCVEVGKVSNLVKEFERAADKLGMTLPRLIIAPNGSKGQRYDSTTQTWIGVKDEKSDWSQSTWAIVKEVQARGKWKGIIVGGCCKTGPQEIASLRRMIDKD